MKQTAISRSQLYALAALVPILAYSLVAAPLTDTGIFAARPETHVAAALRAGWFPMVDLYSNGYFLWRLNPLLLALSAWGGYTAYCLLCIAVSVVGFHQLAADLRSSSLSAAGGALLLWTTLLTAFGINLPVLSLACVFPWLIRAVLHPRPVEIVITGLFTYFTAGHLGVLLAGVLFPLVSCRTAQNSEEHAPHAPGSGFSSLLSLLFLLFFLLLIAVPFTAPHLPSPSYPESGHLVPGYGYSLGIDPIISYGPSKPFIDREFTQQFPIVPALIVLIAGLWTVQVSRDPTAKRIAQGAVIVAAITLLETTLVPPWVRLIAPLQALSRIIPGLIAYPLPLYTAALGVSYLGVLSLFHRDRAVANTALFICLLYYGAGTFHDRAPEVSRSPQTGSHELADALHIRRRLAGASPFQEVWFGTLRSPRVHLFASVLNSPSLYLIRNRPWVLHSGTPVATEAPVGAFSPRISASHNEQALSAITNDRRRDRWSTKLGKQLGIEWIQFEFGEPLELRGLDLTTAKFVTDFPRGIEILGGPSCDTLSVLFREPRWLGSTEFTPDGLPYYSHESIMRLFFEPTTLRCLRILQIGKDPSFEWSVERVLILR